DDRDYDQQFDERESGITKGWTIGFRDHGDCHNLCWSPAQFKWRTMVRANEKLPPAVRFSLERKRTQPPDNLGRRSMRAWPASSGKETRFWFIRCMAGNATATSALACYQITSFSIQPSRMRTIRDP